MKSQALSAALSDGLRDLARLRRCAEACDHRHSMIWHDAWFIWHAWQHWRMGAARRRAVRSIARVEDLLEQLPPIHDAGERPVTERLARAQKVLAGRAAPSACRTGTALAVGALETLRRQLRAAPSATA